MHYRDGHTQFSCSNKVEVPVGPSSCSSILRRIIAGCAALLFIVLLQYGGYRLACIINCFHIASCGCHELTLHLFKFKCRERMAHDKNMCILAISSLYGHHAHVYVQYGITIHISPSSNSRTTHAPYPLTPLALLRMQSRLGFDTPVAHMQTFSSEPAMPPIEAKIQRLYSACCNFLCDTTLCLSFDGETNRFFSRGRFGAVSGASI